MNAKYNYYMRKVDLDGTALENYRNLESNFTGLRYYKTTGLNDIGKAKNIYTEQYAESDRLRVLLPTHYQSGSAVHSTSDIANEATTIVMTFIVIGSESQRETTVKNFEDYVRTGAHSYYDDARYLEFDFIVTEDIKVSDEKWHGSQPYVELEVRMQNLNGKTRVHQTS